MESATEIRPLLDWEGVCKYLPAGWEEQAFDLGAMSYVRKFGPETLLQTCLLHLAGPTSLRQTAAYAKLTGLAEVSSIAFHKRFKKTGAWFQWMAEQIMKMNLERESTPADTEKRQMRIIDATTIQPPGSLGTGWRLHYAIQLPSKLCSQFLVTDSTVGESLTHFEIQRADLVIADRGYAHPKDVAHVVAGEGDVLVRMNLIDLPIRDESGQRIDLLAQLKGLRPGRIREIEGYVIYKKQRILGRVCALRLSKEQAQKARKHVIKRAAKNRSKIRPETLEAAKYLLLFTTVPSWEMGARKIVRLYPNRWQVETSFKQCKSVFGLGQLPNKDPQTAQAWIHGKLLISFLVRAMSSDPESFPPGGFQVTSRAKALFLARGKNLGGYAGRYFQVTLP